jgi:hypothetical protein
MSKSCSGPGMTSPSEVRRNRVNGDPDPACHFGADPGPACHFHAESDTVPVPSFQLKAQNLEKVLKKLIFNTFWLVFFKLMRIQIRMQLIALKLIRIQLITLMRIQIQILDLCGSGSGSTTLVGKIALRIFRFPSQCQVLPYYWSIVTA